VIRFRAAVLHAHDQPLAIEEVTLPPPGPHDVLVRNHASGLCHTDLEVIQGRLPYPFPIVLGHEGAGVVEAVGSEVRELQVGDHVVASWNPHCGSCFHCERDEPVLCEPFRKHQPAGRLLDGKTRLERDGLPLHHFGVVSSHAEYSMVPESGAVSIQHDMPLDRACLIGCGVMTGVGAVIRVANVQAGQFIAVIGCGPVGLNAIQGGRIAGAERILAIDRDPRRLALARQLGATDTFEVDEHVLGQVKLATHGRGVDAAFECAGNEAAMQLAVEAARAGGQVVILGKVPVNDRVAFRFGSMMGEKRITRSSYGGARPKRDFPWLAELYLRGDLALDELITHRLRLDEINTGFDGMRQGEVMRAVVELA
jgi:S-(hydroxymethyl)glutathione dehydrogenase/alcohol dehydrogenase